jgi:hypothetical protein
MRSGGKRKEDTGVKDPRSATSAWDITKVHARKIRTRTSGRTTMARTSEKRQRIIRAVIAANPDISPERIAKIVALTLRLNREKK